MKTNFNGCRQGAMPPVFNACLFGLLLCLLSGRVPASAQASPDAQPGNSAEAVTKKLSGTVHLMLGDVTLPKVCAALSAQTGLTIESAPYLRERSLIVQMDDLPAKDALDALAELNDWTWTDKGEGRILITRRTLLLPQEPGTIPRRMQMALPKDMRAFLNIKAPDANYRQYAPPFAGDFSKEMGAHQAPVQLRLKAGAHLIDSLKPRIFNGEPVTYAGMTPLQQQDWIVWALFKALSVTDAKLLHGDPLPFVADPLRANMKLNGATMLISIPTGPTGESGFGVQITSPQERP